MKAAFLLNFPKYIDWPDECFEGDESRIVLTVFGDRGLEADLLAMSADRLFNGRRVEIRTAGRVEEISFGSHIVFVADSERRSASDVIARVAALSVLTVGEHDDFTANGGIINLARSDRRMRIQINLQLAERARLKISSKLLRVAEIVEAGKG